ncbi:dienelactone hydrolase family protein [Caulobacter segnis]
MSETLTITTPDGDFSAYLARPQAENAPAIVVIQEIFGVNKVMRDICDGLASQGYVAVRPDLFWRIEPGIDITDQSEAEWKRAFELFNAFDVDAGVADIAATISKVRGLPGVNGKVGAVGYRLGGLLAFLTATRTDVDASVSYYGVGIEKHVGEAEKLNHPLLMHIAEKDQFVRAGGPAGHPQRAEGSPADRDPHLRRSRPHAFAREGGAHYDAADAAKANGRSLTFFQKALD